MVVLPAVFADVLVLPVCLLADIWLANEGIFLGGLVI